MLTNLHPPKVIEFALAQITEILKKHIEITSLYYFGMQSSAQGTHNSLNNGGSKQQQHYHFYLLLLSKHISRIGDPLLALQAEALRRIRSETAKIEHLVDALAKIANHIFEAYHLQR